MGQSLPQMTKVKEYEDPSSEDEEKPQS